MAIVNVVPKVREAGFQAVYHNGSIETALEVHRLLENTNFKVQFAFSTRSLIIDGIGEVKENMWFMLYPETPSNAMDLSFLTPEEFDKAFVVVDYNIK